MINEEVPIAILFDKFANISGRGGNMGQDLFIRLDSMQIK